MRGSRLGRNENRPDIDIDRAIEVLECQFAKRAGLEYPGIVHQYVDTTFRCDDGVDGRDESLRVTVVRLNSNALAACRVN